MRIKQTPKDCEGQFEGLVLWREFSSVFFGRASMHNFGSVVSCFQGPLLGDVFTSFQDKDAV